MTKQNSVKFEAYKLVIWQVIVVIVLAAILFLFQGPKNGISTLLGGLAYALPNLFFVWRVFSYMGARSAKKFLVAFLAGEMVKLILSAVFFIMIVKFLTVSVLSMLVGFIGAIIAFWVVSFYVLSHDQEVFL